MPRSREISVSFVYMRISLYRSRQALNSLSRNRASLRAFDDVPSENNVQFPILVALSTRGNFINKSLIWSYTSQTSSIKTWTQADRKWTTKSFGLAVWTWLGDERDFRCFEKSWAVSSIVKLSPQTLLCFSCEKLFRQLFSERRGLAWITLICLLDLSGEFKDAVENFLSLWFNYSRQIGESRVLQRISLLIRKTVIIIKMSQSAAIEARH